MSPVNAAFVFSWLMAISCASGFIVDNGVVTDLVLIKKIGTVNCYLLRCDSENSVQVEVRRTIIPHLCVFFEHFGIVTR